jgi:hypothetical protein
VSAFTLPCRSFFLSIGPLNTGGPKFSALLNMLHDLPNDHKLGRLGENPVDVDIAPGGTPLMSIEPPLLDTPVGHVLADLGGEVGLVADQVEDGARLGVLSGLGDPVPELEEGGGVGLVVDQEDRAHVAVVGADYRPEGLLARRVPDHQLRGHPVRQGHRPRAELDPDRGVVLLGEGLPRVAVQQGALAHRGPPQQDHLEVQHALFGG